ncbi:hypothetical protein Hanom_Chr04g00340751 [Helianthus anomalus]
MIYTFRHLQNFKKYIFLTKDKNTLQTFKHLSNKTKIHLEFLKKPKSILNSKTQVSSLSSRRTTQVKRKQNLHIPFFGAAVTQPRSRTPIVASRSATPLTEPEPSGSL